LVQTKKRKKKVANEIAWISDFEFF
jgi:hypothetical protein